MTHRSVDDSDAVPELAGAGARSGAAGSRSFGKWAHGMLAAAIAALLAGILLAVPLTEHRVAVPWDYLIHLRWSGQFYAALQDGFVTPRWAFASYEGLGDPTFLFYQPLFYYVTSLFCILGFSTEGALLWAGWLSFVLTGTVAAVVLAAFSTKRAALVGLVLTVTCPALFMLNTQIAAYPWIFASPFCILFALEASRGRPSPISLGVLFALVCLSHLLTAMMIVLMTTIARPLMFPMTRRSLPGHGALLGGILLGAGIAAFYLVPAIGLLKTINPGGWQKDDFLDWHRAFAFPVITYALYGWNWFVRQYPLPILALVMAIFALIATRGSGASPRLAADADAPRLARRLAIVALVGFGLSSELAYPLYALFAPLQKLQHPYRFVVPSFLLSIVAFAAACFSRPAPSAWWLRSGAALICLASFGLTLRLESGVLRDSRPSPLYADIIHGDFGQPEYQPATMGQDWRQYNAAGGFEAECRRLSVTCDALARRTQSLQALMATERPQRVRLPLLGFPAWRTSVDGIDQPLSIDRGTGLLEVALPPGRHRVEVRWAALPAEWIGRAISIAALILVGWLGWSSRRIHRAEGAISTRAPL